MSQKIFDKLIHKHKEKFACTMMFGIPISEIDAKALRACICVLGELQQADRKSRQQERDMYKLFCKRGI